MVGLSDNKSGADAAASVPFSQDTRPSSVFCHRADRRRHRFHAMQEDELFHQGQRMRDDLLGDVEMVGEGGQFFIIVNGLKIAVRENRQWTSLVPGYSVEDLDGGAQIAIDVDSSML